MLNDYTYMIEVERHRDALEFATRQRLSHQVGKQHTPVAAWIRSTVARLAARLNTERRTVQTDDERHPAPKPDRIAGAAAGSR